MQQTRAVDARNILHAGADLGRVAAKGQVRAVAVQRKHIHVAVKKALRGAGQVAQVAVARGTPAAVGQGAGHQGHGFLGRALLQFEQGHGFDQGGGAVFQRRGLGHGVFHHLGVLLGDLVELAHRRGDLAQAGALLGAGVGDLRHVGRHIADAADDGGDAGACGADFLYAAAHLGAGGADQQTDFFGGLGRALRQRTHLAGHHRKAPARLARAGGLYCSVQRQDVGLEGQPVDHADDFVHALGTALDGLHRSNGFGHGGRAQVGGIAHMRGLGVGLTGGVGRVLHGAGQLLHAGRRLLQICGLLLGAV